ncbi:MAG: hypothetical protein GY851_31115 [bacterium]|nr:hypothetical protein [bacterium]
MVEPWTPPNESREGTALTLLGTVGLARRERELLQLVVAAGDADLPDVKVEVGPLMHESGGHTLDPANINVGRVATVIVSSLWVKRPPLKVAPHAGAR